MLPTGRGRSTERRQGDSGFSAGRKKGVIVVQPFQDAPESFLCFGIVHEDRLGLAIGSEGRTRVAGVSGLHSFPKDEERMIIRPNLEGNALLPSCWSRWSFHCIRPKLEFDCVVIGVFVSKL